MPLTIKPGSQISFSVPDGVVVTSSAQNVVKATTVNGVCTLEAVSRGMANIKGSYSDIFGGFNVTVS